MLDVRAFVWVRRLSLSRNAIGDAGARAIADLVAGSSRCIAEVALAQNRITRCDSLLEACAGRYPCAYPTSPKNDTRQHPLILDLSRPPRHTQTGVVVFLIRKLADICSGGDV